MVPSAVGCSRQPLARKPRFGTHPSKMSLTKHPKELEGSGPSLSHEIAWSLLHITLLSGVKMLEDQGPAYAFGEVWALGIGVVGRGLIKCHLCFSHLASVGTACLDGCLLFLVPNDPWNCLATQHPGNLLLRVSAEDQQPQHHPELVRHADLGVPTPDLSNENLHFIKISKLVVHTHMQVWEALL